MPMRRRLPVRRGLLQRAPGNLLLLETLKASRFLAGEFLGTTALLAGVVGSGIMAERLAGGNTALALLANALATGFLLPVLILVFSPFCGAYFNPVISLAEMLSGRLNGKRAAASITAQAFGAVSGVWLAHAMFGESLWQVSRHVRAGWSQGLSEAVATFGLTLIVLLRKRFPPGHLPWIIGAYIAAAYFFTASTSFANPAVTLARSLTDTFSGIRPADVPLFVLSQTAGMLTAWLTARWFEGKETP
jgi:glycerol uptake facilitator-like aquaporin